MVVNTPESRHALLADVRGHARKVADAEAALIEAQRARDAAIARAAAVCTLRTVAENAGLHHTRIRAIKDAQSTPEKRLLAAVKGSGSAHRHHAQVRTSR